MNVNVRHQIFEIAKKWLEEHHGYTVVGGWMSPSHDNYVLYKVMIYPLQHLLLRLLHLLRMPTDDGMLWCAAPLRGIAPDHEPAADRHVSSHREELDVGGRLIVGGVRGRLPRLPRVRTSIPLAGRNSPPNLTIRVAEFHVRYLRERFNGREEVTLMYLGGADLIER